MIDRCQITGITHKYNLVYIAACNLDNTSQRVSISMTQSQFESTPDRQLTSMLINALNSRYPSITYNEVNISQSTIDSIEDIIKARINNTMTSFQARFTPNVTTGASPLDVIFIDQSYGVPTSWLWDFGDSTTSTVQHPTHTYSVAGTYTVSLTITRESSTDTETKTDLITIT